MLRSGNLCRSCKSDECKDAGTKEEPNLLECPSCSGKGCDSCDDGWIEIDGCPNSYCADLTDAMEMIDLFHEGIPPVAGGSLDQAEWFLRAARQLKNDEAIVRSMV